MPNTGESSAFRSMKWSWSSGTSSSAKIALAGHSGMHTAQSMHSSGSITKKLGPSRKQSTGQTSTQLVYLHLMQFSVTTRSEEHTSELQSRGQLVCRLLLEKKKKLD